MTRSRRAFTLWELVFVVVVVFILITLFVPAISANRRASRLLKDGTQVRAIQQGMVTWAGNGQDNYPLPSLIDLNDTIPGIDTRDNPRLRVQKNLPRWSLSMMVYLGFITLEVLVSPAEVNPAVRVNTTYQFSYPTAAAPDKRAQAFLDPSFAAYPDEPGGDTPIVGAGGVAPSAGSSYAILAFAGKRMSAWQPTFDGTQAVIGNRGPWYSQDAKHTWSLNRSDRRGAKNILATESNTLLIHGARTTWEGNIARNDGSVNFETRPDPENMPLFPRSPGSELHRELKSRFDNLFANEDEEAHTSVYTSADDNISEATNTRRNNYLRCFGDRAERRFHEKTGQLIALGDFWYD